MHTIADRWRLQAWTMLQTGGNYTLDLRLNPT